MRLRALAHALEGNLTYDSSHERDWDRLTALCWGEIATDRRSSREAHLNALGVALIAFKHSHKSAYHDRAVEGLETVLAWRTKRSLTKEDRRDIAKLAIHEWVVDMCPICLGAGSRQDDAGVDRPCVPCGTSGKRRYSDQERSEMLGRKAHRYSSAISIAHGGIALAVHTASEFAERMLK